MEGELEYQQRILRLGITRDKADLVLFSWSSTIPFIQQPRKLHHLLHGPN
jgi:hypothetical protein